MDYSNFMTANRRLTILKLLALATAYTLHEGNLKATLKEHAEPVGTDVLRADLQWLHDLGLVLAKQPDGVWFATLTARGGEVVDGLITVPGVARPEPK